MKQYLIIMLLFLPIVYAHPCNETEQNISISNISNNNECSIYLNLSTNKLNYKNGEKITIYNTLNDKSHEFKIAYWIEGEFNKIIKEKLETTNTLNKQFTPKLENSTKLIIKNNLTFIACNNTNQQTYNEIPIYVEVEKDPNPYLNLEKIYTKRYKKIELGNNLTATIEAYTGNLSNLTVSMQIKDLTNQTTYLIQNNFSKELFNITTEVPNDCNIQTGTYKLAVTGIGKIIEENITIINKCQIEEVNNTEEMNITLLEEIEDPIDENIINPSENTYTGMLVYESSNQKAKKLANYAGMVIVAIIVAIILLRSDETEEALKESTEKWSSQLEQQLKS